MQRWVALSFFTMALLVIMDIAYKYLIRGGYTAIELTLYPMLIGIVTATLYIAFQRSTSQRLRIPRFQDAWVFLMVGVLFFVAFLTLRWAQQAAPNLGYVNAIVYTSVVLTILGTSALYGSAITVEALFGSVLVVIGIFLITWKSSAPQK